MAFKLVRFVEDLIWHVCPKSDIKKIENSDTTVMAKYGRRFYLALNINEGTKEELIAFRNRYLQQDKVLQKYYKFIPNDDSNSTGEGHDVKNVEKQTIHANTNQATQTDAELNFFTTRVIRKLCLETQIKSQATQTDIDLNIDSTRISLDTLGLKNLRTKCTRNNANQCTQTDAVWNIGHTRSSCTLCHESSCMKNEIAQTPIKSICADQATQTDCDLSSISSRYLCDSNDANSISIILDTFINDTTDDLAPAVTNTGSIINNCEESVQNQISFDGIFTINTQKAGAEPENEEGSVKNGLGNYKPNVNRSKTFQTTVHMQKDKEDINRSKTPLHTREEVRCLFEEVDEAHPKSKIIRQLQSCTPEKAAQDQININERFTKNTEQAGAEPEHKKGTKKFNFCMFCKTKVINFARHLEFKHQNEVKVSEFLKLPKGDAQRLSIIKDIRSLGTYIYNTDPVNKDEDIIVARRCLSNCSTADYVPCPKCKNYFKKSLLYRHYKRCENVSSAPRNLQALSRATVSAANITNYKKLETKILPDMLDDNVSYVAKNDNLILLYGNYLSEKHEGDDHLFSMIRQKLRQLANFLITIRTIEPLVSNLESVFRPHLYNKFIEAVRKCAGYNEHEGTYSAPSLVCALGQVVKECAEKLTIECIKRKDNSLRSDVEAWLLIYKKEFPVLSRRANTIIIRRKWNKPRMLPLTADILKLNNYLKKQWSQAFAILEKGFDLSSWNELARCTLLLLLIFNRKRVGEMEKLLISDYNRKHNIQKDSDTYRNLKPSERIFSQRYVRVEIRGKLGRAVSLMISTQEVSAIDLILKYKTFANVHHDNPYVFGRGENKYFEGARCLREAANNCHADQPALLRGTKLRKHIATVSQALNLTENELSILADYMGHNIDIHRHFYRLPNEAIHLAKVSQLLYALDTNKIEKYKGKSLDEINFDVDIDIESDSGNDQPEGKSSKKTQAALHVQKERAEINSLNISQTTTHIDEPTAENQININETFTINTEEVGAEPEHEKDSVHMQNDKEEINRSKTPLHMREEDCSTISNSDEEEWFPDIRMKKRKIRRMQSVSPEKATPEKATPEKAVSCLFEEVDEQQWTPNRKRKKVARICPQRQTWRTPEKYAMRMFFKTHLSENKLPSYADCERAIVKNSALRQRTKQQIKLWISNELKKRKSKHCSRQLFDFTSN